VYRQQIALENAGIAHACAPDPKQVVRTRPEQQRVYPVMSFNVLHGKHRAAGSDPANDRDSGRPLQPDAARSTRGHLDCSFAGQSTQMLLGGIG
jgi:hypothetical protein